MCVQCNITADVEKEDNSLESILNEEIEGFSFIE